MFVYCDNLSVTQFVEKASSEMIKSMPTYVCIRQNARENCRRYEQTIKMIADLKTKRENVTRMGSVKGQVHSLTIAVMKMKHGLRDLETRAKLEEYILGERFYQKLLLCHRRINY